MQAIHELYTPGEDSAVDTLLVTARRDLDTIYDYLNPGLVHKADDFERETLWERTRETMWQRVWETTYITAMDSLNRRSTACYACDGW